MTVALFILLVVYMYFSNQTTDKQIQHLELEVRQLKRDCREYEARLKDINAVLSIKKGFPAAIGVPRQ